MRRKIVRFGGWVALGILAFGLVSEAHAQEKSFCSSQLELLNKYLGPLVKPISSPAGKEGQAVGVVGVTLKLGEEPCFFCGGEMILGSGVPPDANTIFELASVTKVFTTAILALRAQQGLAWTPPSSRTCRPTTRCRRASRSVTFQQLATFTGGFPWSSRPVSTGRMATARVNS